MNNSALFLVEFGIVFQPSALLFVFLRKMDWDIILFHVFFFFFFVNGFVALLDLFLHFCFL